MLSVWLGALLVVAGLLFTAYQAIARGRMSDARRSRSPAGETLEPRGGRGAFSLETNWPGLALIAIGGILLLTAPF